MNRTGGAAVNTLQPYRVQRVQRSRQVILNARRAGGRLLVFDRVDVAATVERSVDGALVPVVVAVRDADRRYAQSITEELRRAKTRRAPQPQRGPLSGAAGGGLSAA